jgi:GNAT superfamily N-acetyltransferase
MASKIRTRRATSADEADIRALQAASVRVHCAGYYEPSEIDGLVAEAGALCRDVLDGGTYLVTEIDGDIVACGGWSVDSARPDCGLVCGLFVDPACARRGLASALLATIEADMLAAGLDGAELATTYSGMPVCTAAGYRPLRLVDRELADSRRIHGVLMAKPLYGRVALAA